MVIPVYSEAPEWGMVSGNFQRKTEGVQLATDALTLARIEAMLLVYVEWLNKWQADSDVEATFYNLETFGPPWGIVVYVAKFRSYYDTVVIEASEGDEGGGATLIGWFNANDGPLFPPDDIVSPRAITQEFDTYVQFIYNDTVGEGEGPWFNTPAHEHRGGVK